MKKRDLYVSNDEKSKSDETVSYKEISLVIIGFLLFMFFLGAYFYIQEPIDVRIQIAKDNYHEYKSLIFDGKDLFFETIESCIMCGSYLEDQISLDDPDLFRTQGRVSFSENVAEEYMLEMINYVRARHGLRQLERDSELDRLANYHNNNMKDQIFFSHTDLDGRGPSDRARFLGIRSASSYISENIAKVPESNCFEGKTVVILDEEFSSYTAAKCHMKGYLQSIGHYQNILYEDHKRVGISFEYDPDFDMYYSTQNFGD